MLTPDQHGKEPAWGGDAAARYRGRLEDLRTAFRVSGDGFISCVERSQAVDELIQALWSVQAINPELEIAVMALGGYGRQQLFPASDVDLLFCTARGVPEELSRNRIRQFTEVLWDCGLRVSPATRTLADCERFKASDPEFSLALLDVRFVAGHQGLADLLLAKILQRRSTRDAHALASSAAELTRERHARFGNTLFHLEPNVKDSPGGLRDAHVCRWLEQLRSTPVQQGETSFSDAVRFLTAVRVFLHLRSGRDHNVLDWQAQDQAAAEGIGITEPEHQQDAAAWMRTFFRHARAVERLLVRECEASELLPKPSRSLRRVKAPPLSGFYVREGVLDLKTPTIASNGNLLDPARESEIVLTAFGLLASAGVKLGHGSEQRIAASLPFLSGNLEDGPRLWARLRTILLGSHAGTALRELHALGVLELILPEFHGIDALVIRDAYHRYTVDEHTFVLIDMLHLLATDVPLQAPEWRVRFRQLLVEMPHLDLLLLAALLHDTGKGRAGDDHATVSGHLAARVCSRLELGSYETNLVVRLVECHLEMSAALRRDIFDLETVRPFADKVASHELLRMLTLFTYADISAVHPDALTPWKAENLWRLSMAAANQLDRSVDEDRVNTRGSSRTKAVSAILDTLGRSSVERNALEYFLEGFPERYLRARPGEIIKKHFDLLTETSSAPVLLTYKTGVGEVTIVSKDRLSLFADLAGTLADWGMDVVTADAFSNAHGVVVDTFRFVDTYRTLEMNPGEADRLTGDLVRVLQDPPAPHQRAAARRGRRIPSRRAVDTVLEFDNEVSSHSTLLQIVAQNLPGLLRTAAIVLSQAGCSVEVALIDSEADMAIDVFYLTRAGQKLTQEQTTELEKSLSEAIHANAHLA